jgi:RNA polymerase sigma factor (sigma-70 family)
VNPAIEAAIRTLDGTADRFLQLLRDHRGRIDAIAAQYARTGSERLELEADLLIAVWKVCEREGVRDVDAFVRQTMKNAAIDWARSRRTGGVPLDEDRLAPVEPGTDSVTLDLTAAILDLPDELRAVAELMIGGYDADEVGERLGLSRRTVFRRWGEARDLLRAKLN